MSFGAIGSAAYTGGSGQTAEVFNPTLWSKEVQLAVENQLVAARLVKRMDEFVKDGGDTVNIPQLANMSSAQSRSVSTVSQIQIDTITQTSLTLNLNKRYYEAFLVDDMLTVQSKYMFADLMKEKAVYGLALQIDTDVLALQSGNTNSAVGTLGQDPTLDDWVAAALALDQANAPDTERYAVIGPKTKAAWLKTEQFINTRYVPDEPIKTGIVGERLGVTIYWTNNIPTSSAHEVNQMFHKDAYLLAIQKQIGVEKMRRPDYTGDLYVATCIYGVLNYRTTFGVAINGK